MLNKSLAVVVISCIALTLGSCANPKTSRNIDPFAGNWQGSGVDSQGNEFNFAAKVISLGDQKYRMLVLDKIDTQKEPMHIMDGVLKGNKFIYTSDNSTYVGECEIGDELLIERYKELLADPLSEKLATRIVRLKFILWGVICGVFIALITGFIEHRPETSIIGAKYHGYPRVWRITHVPQTFQPIKYLLSELFIDILFWSIAVLIVFIILEAVKEQLRGNKLGN